MAKKNDSQVPTPHDNPPR